VGGAAGVYFVGEEAAVYQGEGRGSLRGGLVDGWLGRGQVGTGSEGSGRGRVPVGCLGNYLRYVVGLGGWGLWNELCMRRVVIYLGTVALDCSPRYCIGFFRLAVRLQPGVPYLSLRRKCSQTKIKASIL
jgi:hypothetical protein